MDRMNRMGGKELSHEFHELHEKGRSKKEEGGRAA
jgi:hypothetical protein